MKRAVRTPTIGALQQPPRKKHHRGSGFKDCCTIGGTRALVALSGQPSAHLHHNVPNGPCTERGAGDLG
ncbi:hypothetical protein JTE90_025190 [Oedothorax gibbosus]|uniref:Uncharacterized protein n=1 Tax=Oedothorax gibbosus TaxID=931172 RepID=A0AAV6UC07_9ARAC|nr:hypothetical protein JTE90_025190 [Oedothorax gibbosus]